MQLSKFIKPYAKALCFSLYEGYLSMKNNVCLSSELVLSLQHRCGALYHGQSCCSGFKEWFFTQLLCSRLKPWNFSIWLPPLPELGPSPFILSCTLPWWISLLLGVLRFFESFLPHMLSISLFCQPRDQPLFRPHTRKDFIALTTAVTTIALECFVGLAGF